MQFGEFTPFFIILVGLGVIEWVIGNVVEPKLMGNSLKPKSTGYNPGFNCLGADMGNYRYAFEYTYYGGHGDCLLTICKYKTSSHYAFSEWSD